MFSVSITHNSKIRELSDGNRIIVCQTTFLLWVPPFLSYELWKLRIEIPKKPIQTPPKLPIPIKILVLSCSILFPTEPKTFFSRFSMLCALPYLFSFYMSLTLPSQFAICGRLIIFYIIYERKKG